MIKNKRINWICGGAVLFMLLVALVLMGNGKNFLQAAASTLPYAEKLFDTSQVHTIDIVVKETEWQEMLEQAASEEYIACSAVIDGEAYQNIAIRPKGNSSLRTVASSNSNRYSFKLEFDHYNSNLSYYGLDKLCLNNLIQDNTCLKDFLCYQMMNSLEADSPLCSYVWVTVNGKDWGLYLATEAIEEAFALRSYGKDYGKLYKPDSMDMGGGGRGAEARNILESEGENEPENMPSAGFFQNRKNFLPGEFGGKTGGIGGSADVLLQYVDDNLESYPNIFDNAVFPVTDSDKNRLVASLKKLGEGDIEASVNKEEVLRYFAVHNFVLNEDSYTGSLIHNYYLYEKDGLLSMVAWDYNLAFGGMGTKSGDATSLVNSPIDSPVTSGNLAERPMVAWVFEEESYIQQYHDILQSWITDFFDSGYFEEFIDFTIALISPYVKQDPTAFCSYEEFQESSETLKNFCLLRAESIKKQIDGSIPSTSEGQQENNSSLLDASSLDVASMGSSDGFGGKDREAFPERAPASGSASTGDPEEGLSGESSEKERAIGNNIPSGGSEENFPGKPLEGERTMENNTPPGDSEGSFPGKSPEGERTTGDNTPPGGSEGNFPGKSSEGNAAGDNIPPEAPEGNFPNVPPEEDIFSERSEEPISDLPEQTSPSQENPSPSLTIEDDTEDTFQEEAFPNNRGPQDRPLEGEGMSRMQNPEAHTTSSRLETWLLLGGSIALLIFGLAFAKFYG